MVTPKDKDITIGNILSEHTFVSGTKYWKIDSATYEDEEFRVGTSVGWVDIDLDDDEDDFIEYRGKIDFILITEKGEVEVSIDNLNIGGRVDLDSLIKYSS